MMFRRMGIDGCRKAGWIRIGFAVLSFADRLLLHCDLDKFLSPTTGLLPIQKYEEGLFGLLSLVRFAESDELLWMMHYIGLANCLFLLLGVAPRFNAILLLINTCGFHNAHSMLVDGSNTGQAPMARIFNFHLLFLPLHHINIYDGFGFSRRGKNHNSQNETWPMWTVWLWQWETVLIFFGAMLGKYDGEHWTNGTAMYYVRHCTDECIGLFNPDVLFNRVLPSKLMTWSALFIETLSPFTIWLCGLPRNMTLVAVMLLLFGMDISMTMHTFEWYGMLGWSLFFIQKQTANEPVVSAGGKRAKVLWLRTVIGWSVFAVVLVSEFYEAFPMDLLLYMSPQWINNRSQSFLQSFYTVKQNHITPFTTALGFNQDVWFLYDGGYDGMTAKLSADALLTNGTIMKWDSPNWQDLGRWEHKRLYNHMAYYKHIPDCEFYFDDPCVEWENLLRHLMMTFMVDRKVKKEDVVAITLWAEQEFPPDYPEGLGYWDPLDQPLVKESVVPLIAWESEDYHCSAVDSDTSGEHHCSALNSDAPDGHYTYFVKGQGDDIYNPGSVTAEWAFQVFQEYCLDQRMKGLGWRLWEI